VYYTGGATDAVVSKKQSTHSAHREMSSRAWANNDRKGRKRTSVLSWEEPKLQFPRRCQADRQLRWSPLVTVSRRWHAGTGLSFLCLMIARSVHTPQTIPLVFLIAGYLSTPHVSLSLSLSTRGCYRSVYGFSGQLVLCLGLICTFSLLESTS
jgi:hypothetical protein